MPELLTCRETPQSIASRVAGFKSEWWPDLFRNGGRHQIGTMAGFASEYLAGFNRNPQPRAARVLSTRCTYTGLFQSSAGTLMDTQTSTSPALFHAAAPVSKPVAVTRWTAQLAEAQCERHYRVQRFPDDRRRALLLLTLITVAGALNFLGELYAYLHVAGRLDALVPPLVSSIVPVFGLLVLARINSPRMLETLMVAGAAAGVTTRMAVLTLHPQLISMWPTLMIGVIFVFYLYLPVRFVASVVLAACFSIVAAIWWWRLQLQYPVLPGEEVYRGILWLALANALGFTAANSLQRGQRIQYAQNLVLQQLLSTDALTGIANRRHFDDMLEREWRRCARAGTPLSLLMIDVDHFKAYNDYCGHLQGDDCLREVARLLVESLGRPGDLVARYGGEEFVCLLPAIGGAGALAVTTRLAAALREADIPHPRSPLGPRLTVSIGVATANDLSGPPNALVGVADKLLYAAKAAGRNQIKVGQLAGKGVVVRAA